MVGPHLYAQQGLARLKIKNASACYLNLSMAISLLWQEESWGGGGGGRGGEGKEKQQLWREEEITESGWAACRWDGHRAAQNALSSAGISLSGHHFAHQGLLALGWEISGQANP